MTENHTAYSLARLAEVAPPDSSTSPGATFLTSVADRVEDVRDAVENVGLDRSDAIFEAADSAVPIYNYERMQVFTDLCAWTVDIDGLGGETADVIDLAGVALLEVARTLLSELLDDDEED